MMRYLIPGLLVSFTSIAQSVPGVGPTFLNDATHKISTTATKIIKVQERISKDEPVNTFQVLTQELEFVPEGGEILRFALRFPVEIETTVPAIDIVAKKNDVLIPGNSAMSLISLDSIVPILRRPTRVSHVQHYVTVPGIECKLDANQNCPITFNFTKVSKEKSGKDLKYVPSVCAFKVQYRLPENEENDGVWIVPLKGGDNTRVVAAEVLKCGRDTAVIERP